MAQIIVEIPHLTKALALTLGRWANSKFRFETYPKADASQINRDIAVVSSVLSKALRTSASDGDTCWEAIAKRSDRDTLAAAVPGDRARQYIKDGLFELAQKRTSNAKRSLQSESMAKTGPKINGKDLEDAYGAFGLALWAKIAETPSNEHNETATTGPLSSQLEKLRRHGVHLVRANRDDMPGSFEDHFIETNYSLEILGHAFRSFDKIHFQRFIVEKFFSDPRERHLCISVLDPDPELGLMKAFARGQGRTNIDTSFEAHALTLLNNLLDLRTEVAERYGERAAGRFAIETHTNLFGTLVFRDRGTPQGWAQTENVFGKMGVESMTGLNLRFSEEPGSLYQNLADEADHMRTSGRPWPRPDLLARLDHLIGHRGCAPENTNTIRGFKHGLEQGLRSFELDVRLSSDSQVVCSHPATVYADETYLEVGAATANQLARAAAIPTMKQVLDLLAGRASVIIELKPSDGEIGTLPRAVAQLLDERADEGRHDNIAGVSSFRHDAALQFRAESRHHQDVVGFHWPSNIRASEAVRKTVSRGVRKLYLHYSTVMDTPTAAFPFDGIDEITCWVVNSHAAVSELEARGVTHLVSDDPLSVAGGQYWTTQAIRPEVQAR
jgi:glycerophosphoryl diester phosphodiesterase